MIGQDAIDWIKARQPIEAVAGRSVRLRRSGTDRLVLETTLAVWTAHGRTGRPLDGREWWAAGDLGNLAGRASASVAHPTLKRPDGRPQRVPGPDPDPDDAGLAIPQSVTEIVLLGDGDSEPVLTRYAMARAARRFRAPGRTIRCAFAPTGLDFNDLLRAG